MTKKQMFKSVKIIVIALIAIVATIEANAQTIIIPTIKSKTTFAIVIDKVSYEKTKLAVDKYRKSIENDNLGTYLIIGEWQSPTQIRDILYNLYKKQPPLEGAVFVGDIPIAMVRDAQHMTTAFKMNQKANWQDSSVPSDRFYDDFKLKFDFIKQDSTQSLYFYYSLRSNSAQRINSDIYSARIKPTELKNEDKYKLLENYLLKVVSEKEVNANNPINNLSMARGHGYNSDSNVSWAGEQSALKEHLPMVFGVGNRVRFIDFETRYPAKKLFFSEISYPEQDILIFHHHGSPKVQYINGYMRTTEVNNSIENVKLYLRSKVRNAKNKEKTIDRFVQSLGVPRNWCEEGLEDKFAKEDSIFEAQMDIITDEIRNITPNARFVIFDACYNGSFHKPDYIAGSYIFNDGKTIVTQGNTVNVLQDKWTNEFIGLLNAGVRVGQWARQSYTLESHIIGDPTYHFAAQEKIGFDINEALALKRNNIKFWLKQLKNSPLADVQSISLKMLTDSHYPNIERVLNNTYFNSPFGIVRLEAMKQLARMPYTKFENVLKYAVNDPYEMVRRLAVTYIGKNGNEELMPILVNSYFMDNMSERVFFNAYNGLKNFDLQRLEKEIQHQAEQLPFHYERDLKNILLSIGYAKKSDSTNIVALKDTARSVKSKRSEITYYRNYPALRGAPRLLELAQDANQHKESRIQAYEALGWYNYSFLKNDILHQLQQIVENEKDIDIKKEIQKTINRLNEY